MVHLRLLLIALVIAAVIYLAMRAFRGAARNPYWRANLAQFGALAARLFILRNLFLLLSRALRLLRFFR